MVNRLKITKINAILTLHEQGWSQRKIAEQLGRHRETVARYLANRAKPAKPSTGCDGPGDATEAVDLEAENRPIVMWLLYRKLGAVRDWAVC